MKKITLSILALAATLTLQAQFSYTTLKTDGFEVSEGLPETFTRTGQADWATATPAYTGGFWNLIFASTTPKDYVVSADQTEFRSGTQSVKIVTGTATAALRLRTVTGTPFTTGIGEWTKYKVTIWAKAAAGTQVFDKIATLATGGWDKYEFTSNYSTGTSETRMMLDLKSTGGTNTTIYLDDLKVESYSESAPVTNDATNISGSGFTANWAAVTGATGYTLYVQESADNGVTFTLTAPGTPVTITDGTTTSQSITGLNPNTVYRYKIVATDGTYSSPTSNYTNVTTTGTTTGLSNYVLMTAYVSNGVIFTELANNELIEVFTISGQKVISLNAVAGINQFTVGDKGVYLIKVANHINKVIVN
jgi:hypothetical protein